MCQKFIPPFKLMEYITNIQNIYYSPMVLQSFPKQCWSFFRASMHKSISWRLLLEWETYCSAWNQNVEHRGSFIEQHDVFSRWKEFSLHFCHLSHTTCIINNVCLSQLHNLNLNIICGLLLQWESVKALLSTNGFSSKKRWFHTDQLTQKIIWGALKKIDLLNSGEEQVMGDVCTEGLW